MNALLTLALGFGGVFVLRSAPAAPQVHHGPPEREDKEGTVPYKVLLERDDVEADAASRLAWVAT